MNESASSNDTVTGKAVGTAMGVGASALMIGGGMLMGTKAIKGLFKGAANVITNPATKAAASNVASGIKSTASKVASSNVANATKAAASQATSATRTGASKAKETILQTAEDFTNARRRTSGERLFNTPRDFK